MMPVDGSEVVPSQNVVISDSYSCENVRKERTPHGSFAIISHFLPRSCPVIDFNIMADGIHIVLVICRPFGRLHQIVHSSAVRQGTITLSLFLNRCVDPRSRDLIAVAQSEEKPQKKCPEWTPT